MTSTALLDPEPPELLALAGDPDPTIRAVGTAILRTVRDDLDPAERSWVEAIEALRGRLDASPEEIDTALQNRRGIEKPMVVGEVAVRRSKKGPWALLLLAIGRELRPERILELGTCLGISGAYLAAAAGLNERGRLVTLEGAPALAAHACTNLEELGLNGVEVVAGLFRNTLPGVLDRSGPIDLAFIDGHHDEAATQEYFEQLLAHLADPAVVVFDDIAWSDGMVRAWRAICVHPAVRVAVDLERVGVCVVGDGAGTRRVSLPSLTATSAAVRRQRIALERMR